MAKDTQVYSYDKCVVCSEDLAAWPGHGSGKHPEAAAEPEPEPGPKPEVVAPAPTVDDLGLPTVPI